MSTISGLGQSGDRGDADPLVAAALRQYEVQGGGEAAVIAALTDSRLLVPITAVLTQEGATEGGVRHDKAADVAVPLLQRPDGRKALLAFTSSDSMASWDATSRPRPSLLVDAAQLALSEGASALVIDVSGPVTFVIEKGALKHIAAGHAVVATSSGYVWLETPLP